MCLGCVVRVESTRQDSMTSQRASLAGEHDLSAPVLYTCGGYVQGGPAVCVVETRSRGGTLTAESPR